MTGAKRCCNASQQRLFVAVELASVARQVEEIQSLLRAVAADVNWVRPENFHLTLKFLGATPDERIESIRQALARAVSGMEPFEVELSRVGAFPSPSRARVVWVGLAPERPLVQLAGRVEDELEGLGVAREERPFAAHVTMGRRRTPRRDEMLQKTLGELTVASGARSRIAEAVLMQSHLRPGGPVYTPVARFPFKG